MADLLDFYGAEWERAKGIGPSASSRFGHVRQAALDYFLAHGFPTTQDEEWRFTSVAPISDRTFTLVTHPHAYMDRHVAAARLGGELAAELVFVDGRFVPTLSRQYVFDRGLRVESLASAIASRHDGIQRHLAAVAPYERGAFIALNTAFLSDGAYVELSPATILQQPIHVLFVATGRHDGRTTMAHPRVLAVLGPNSQATIVETYVGPEEIDYFTNAVTEIVVGENAVLDRYSLQYEGTGAYHVGATYALAERSATCNLHAINAGGALVRNDVVTRLDGEGVDCTLNGLYLADGQRLIDNHTTIDHAHPHCASREIYKGILAERAHGVFNGKIIVRPDAQKTDAKQTNRALLLSEDARINTKPQLEIFANDVKCTHGAAVGQLDDEALFYLRSRGLGEAQARQLLVHAFAADVLNRLPLEPVRAAVEHRLQRQLAAKLRAA